MLNKTTASQRGYTLVEILIAIGIISFMAALSIPFYRSISMNIDLNAEARDLASDLRQAQQLSVTEQVNYQVIFNKVSNSYIVQNSRTSATIKTKNIPSPITIMTITGLNSDIAEFNATGAASTTGSIILTNPNLRQATIEIKPSGYVKIGS